ncbi:MAG: NHLP bacteriocin export ABC transporter permease/ATPase subunit [Lentisphaerae bacterium]|nr:NHLP bacteriocin export ABC transporter permease/ATPase subunit [Lentisphaerota bacterium]
MSEHLPDEKIQAVFSAAGEIAHATGHDPWLLNDPAALWRVARGDVDIFAVPVADGKVAGNRRHLFRVAAGQIIPGLPPVESIALLAVPVMDAELVRLDRERLPFTSDVLPCFSAWINNIANAIAATTPQPAAAIGDWAALDAFHAGALAALLKQEKTAALRGSERLAQRAEILEETFRASLAGASALLDERVRFQTAFDTKGDTLLAACKVIGQYDGMEFQAPPAGETDSSSGDPVRAVAQASGIRMRRVTLFGDWRKREHGPLLAFAGDLRHPVALIPEKPGRYRLVDPVTRLSRRLDAAAAGTILETAYMFYRPLPPKPIRSKELLAYAMKGAGRDIATIIGMGILGGLLSLLLPWLTGIIYANIIPGGETNQLMQIAAGLIVATVSSMIFTLTRSFAILRIEGRADNALQAAVWDRVLAMPVNFFRQFTTGDLATRIMTINSIRQILSGTVISSVLSGVFSIFNLALIFYYSWKMAILAVILVAIAMLVTFFVAIFQLKYQRQALNLKGEISGMTFQFLSAIAKLHDTASEIRAFARWSKRFTAAKQVGIRAQYYDMAETAFNSAYGLFCTLCVFAVYFFFLKGTISNAHFLAFIAALAQFMVALLSMCNAAVSIYNIRPMYERARPILENIPEVDPTRLAPGILKGRIELRQLTFRYRPDLPLVLQSFNMTIAPGEYVGIVGPSGVGKSTIFRLLLGFEAPEAGDIFYDGKSLKRLNLPALRRQISVVLQNGRLFGGSIFDNIVGASALTMDDAWRAARLAGMEDDIKAMPMGLHTVVPANGGTLSGGQCQRLLIARSFVKQSPILLFDEATSALDNQTQEIVMRTLNSLKITRIVIAQRINTIVNAHRICVLTDGRIVQEGDYQTLLNQPGPFQDLCRRQML